MARVEIVRCEDVDEKVKLEAYLGTVPCPLSSRPHTLPFFEQK